MAPPKRISVIFFILILLASNCLSAQQTDEAKISGTIFLSDETYLHFDDILYIHGFIAPTSRLNRYKAFKVMYENSVRVISIYTLKLMRIDSYLVATGQEGTPVLRNALLRVETKSRESLEMLYFELAWVLVSTRDEKTNKITEERIPFIENGQLNIQKIIFD